MKVPLVAQAAVHSTCSRQHEHTLAGLPCPGRSSQPYHSTRTCLRRCCGIPRSIAVVEFWEQSVPHTLCTYVQLVIMLAVAACLTAVVVAAQAPRCSMEVLCAGAACDASIRVCRVEQFRGT